MCMVSNIPLFILAEWSTIDYSSALSVFEDRLPHLQLWRFEVAWSHLSYIALTKETSVGPIEMSTPCKGYRDKKSGSDAMSQQAGCHLGFLPQESLESSISILNDGLSNPENTGKPASRK